MLSPCQSGLSPPLRSPWEMFTTWQVTRGGGRGEEVIFPMTFVTYRTVWTVQITIYCSHLEPTPLTTTTHHWLGMLIPFWAVTSNFSVVSLCRYLLRTRHWIVLVLFLTSLTSAVALITHVRPSEATGKTWHHSVIPVTICRRCQCEVKHLFGLRLSDSILRPLRFQSRK